MKTVEATKELWDTVGVRQLEALALVDEEGLLRMDTLARRMGIPLCEAERVVQGCVDRNLAVARRILLIDPAPWVWLSDAGREVVGSNRPPLTQPSMGKLGGQMATAWVRAWLVEHNQPQRGRFRAFLGRIAESRPAEQLRGSLRTLAEAIVSRLAAAVGYSLWRRITPAEIQRADVQWVPKRDLISRDDPRANRSLPDAVVRLEDRTIAILIQLSPRAPRRMRHDLVELMHTWRDVYCFCPPELRPRIERIAGEMGLKQVQVFDLPDFTYVS